MHKIWPGRRAHKVKYENINYSDLDSMSLASFAKVGQSGLKMGTKYSRIFPLESCSRVVLYALRLGIFVHNGLSRPRCIEWIPGRSSL